VEESDYAARGPSSDGLAPLTADGAEASYAGAALPSTAHVVLLGDSTLDNGRYLNLAFGEFSIERQLSKRCAQRGWDFTLLAKDGSLLEDVISRQLPLIPVSVTHVVISASGNNLLALLNDMVSANWSVRSLHAALWEGLRRTAALYREVVSKLRDSGCHIAMCTVYRPNFSDLFFKSLATVALRVHNGRLEAICEDFDCSVLDLANILEGDEDFANPLELSTNGGAKVVENIAAFVGDHPVLALRRYQHNPHLLSTEDDAFLPIPDVFGFGVKCCSTRRQSGRVYSNRVVTSDLKQLNLKLAGGPLGRPLVFSEEQHCWREA